MWSSVSFSSAQYTFMTEMSVRKKRKDERPEGGGEEESG